MATQSVPETSKRRTHTVEPELQQPLPRVVRPGALVKVFRWLSLAGLVLCGVLLALGQLELDVERSPGGFLALVFTALTLFIWPILELSYLRSRRLCRDGIATVGVMQEAPEGVGEALRTLGSALLRRGAGRSIAIRYRYRTAADEWREATRRIDAGFRAAPAWAEPGATVTVLYDPSKPARHVVYPYFKGPAKVVPPERTPS
jgi:hypothetical protein